MLVQFTLLNNLEERLKILKKLNQKRGLVEVLIYVLVFFAWYIDEVSQVIMEFGSLGDLKLVI